MFWWRHPLGCRLLIHTVIVEGQGAVLWLFPQSINLIYEVQSLSPNHTLEVPPPNTITLGIRFQHVSLGEGEGKHSGHSIYFFLNYRYLFKANTVCTQTNRVSCEVSQEILKKVNSSSSIKHHIKIFIRNRWGSNLYHHFQTFVETFHKQEIVLFFFSSAARLQNLS